MYEDIEMNRRKYRILVAPLGSRTPEAPQATIYAWEGEHLGPKPIKEKVGEPGETVDDLLRWARFQIEIHSKTWNSALRYRCPSSGLLVSAGIPKPAAALTPDDVWKQRIELKCIVCGQKHQLFLG